MTPLPLSVIKSFNLALEKLTGYERRAYAAALTIAHFDGSARKAERILSVSRKMVELGLKAQQTGIRCEDAYGLRGRKKEEWMPGLVSDIEEVAEANSQSKRCHKDTKGYLKITEASVKNFLLAAKG